MGPNCVGICMILYVFVDVLMHDYHNYHSQPPSINYCNVCVVCILYWIGTPSLETFEWCLSILLNTAGSIFTRPTLILDAFESCAALMASDLALRILGPSNGPVWTHIAGVRVLKIAILEGSGFLGCKECKRTLSRKVVSFSSVWSCIATHIYLWLDIASCWLFRLGELLSNFNPKPNP